MLKTSEYPYFDFSFEYFNPIQEKCYPYFTEDCNFVISSSMSSGKTAMAEAILAYELDKPNTKACYVSPLKALSKEKYDDWSNRFEFIDKGLCLLSSDNYIKDNDLNVNRLIMATIEALDVKIRKQADWIKHLRCLIFDEAHLIGHQKRGADAEALIMGLTKLNPDCRIIFLSGTLKNSKEIAQWLKLLNGKTTRFVQSNWTPCRIEKELRLFNDNDDMCLQIYEEISADLYDEKLLIFVHSKKFGTQLVEFLLSKDINTAFYHSDLDRKRRINMAKRFKDDDNNLNVLVSTSALGMGINL